MTYYVVRLGYAKDKKTLGTAVRKMKDPEYKQAIQQSAKICKNQAAVAVLKLGNLGEKGLTAIIVAAENAAKAAGDWLQF